MPSIEIVQNVFVAFLIFPLFPNFNGWTFICKSYLGRRIAAPNSQELMCSQVFLRDLIFSCFRFLFLEITSLLMSFFESKVVYQKTSLPILPIRWSHIDLNIISHFANEVEHREMQCFFTRRVKPEGMYTTLISLQSAYHHHRSNVWFSIQQPMLGHSHRKQFRELHHVLFISKKVVRNLLPVA